MCLAIYKPKGITLPKKYLKNACHNNDDGAGFAVAENGKVAIYKGYFSFSEFYKAYKSHATKTAIIHFRMSTHGLTNAANCHPFGMCGDTFAMIHNGVLDIQCHDKAKSDTAHFSELVLAPMLEKLAFDDTALKYLIETSIGTENKVVVLRGDGAHVIYNEGSGKWDKGAWFSNDSYKTTYGGLWDSITDHWTNHCGYSYSEPNYKGGKYNQGKWEKYDRESFPDYKGCAAYYKGPAMDDEVDEWLDQEARADRAASRLLLTQAEQDEIENEKYSG